MSLFAEIWAIRPLRWTIFGLLGSLYFGIDKIMIPCIIVLATFVIVVRLPNWVHRMMLRNKFSRGLSDLLLTFLAAIFLGASNSENIIVAIALAGLMISFVIDAWAKQSGMANYGRNSALTT